MEKDSFIITMYLAIVTHYSAGYRFWAYDYKTETTAVNQELFIKNSFYSIIQLVQERYAVTFLTLCVLSDFSLFNLFF